MRGARSGPAAGTQRAVAVGVDPSLRSTGLACVRGDGSWAVAAAEGDRPGGVGRLVSIRERVVEWVLRWGPAIVAVEGYALSPSRQLWVDLGELGGALKVALWELGYREERGTLVVVPPALLKKFATGKGNADKRQVAVAVYKRWGVEAGTSDEVDAYVLARIGLALLGAEDRRMPAAQRAVVDRVRALARLAPAASGA